MRVQGRLHLSHKWCDRKGVSTFVSSCLAGCIVASIVALSESYLQCHHENSMMKLNTSPRSTRLSHTRACSRRRRDPDGMCTRHARRALAAGRGPPAPRCAFAALGAGVGCSADSRGGATPPRPRPGRQPDTQSLRHTGRADTRRSLAKSRTNRTCPVTTHDPRRVRRLRTTMQIMRPWMHAAQITNRTTSRPRTQSPASRVPPRVAYAACSLGRGVHHVHAALARPLHL